MKLNVGEFKSLLKKATLNFSFESVQLNFTKKSVKSGMISNTQTSVAIINQNVNNVLPEMKDGQDFSFNFQDPNTKLLPFLALVDDDQPAEIDVSSEKIVVVCGKMRMDMHFCGTEIVRVFNRESPRANIQYYYNRQLDDDFMMDFSKIKKIGPIFGKVYFSVKKNTIYMEASEKTNLYSNRLSFELDKVKVEDHSLYFEYKDIINAFSVIGDDYAQFKLNISYIKEQDMGLIYLEKSDSSEKYFVMSRLE